VPCAAYPLQRRLKVVTCSPAPHYLPLSVACHGALLLMLLRLLLRLLLVWTVLRLRSLIPRGLAPRGLAPRGMEASEKAADSTP